MRSGLISMPTPRQPNFLAALKQMRLSPQPKSNMMSLLVMLASSNILSMTSSSVATKVVLAYLGLSLATWYLSLSSAPAQIGASSRHARPASWNSLFIEAAPQGVRKRVGALLANHQNYKAAE